MRLNRKGFVIEGAALVIITILSLFVLPQNPISGALGVGVRPNKTVHVEKVEFIREHGEIIGTKTITKDDEIQEHVTFLEWVRSNIILVILTFLFLLVTGGLGKVWQVAQSWKRAFKNQVDGLKNIKDTTVICRKCGDPVTIDTKKEAFEDVTAKMDKKDIVLQEVVKTELVK